MSRLELWNTKPLANHFWEEALDFVQDVDRVFAGSESYSASGSAPPADVLEFEESFKLSVDLPGLKQEDISIEFHDGSLVLKAKRNHEVHDEKFKSIRKERLFGLKERKFKLPKGTASNQISASLERGVLEISIPKAEESKPMKISIGSTHAVNNSEAIKPAKKKIANI